VPSYKYGQADSFLIKVRGERGVSEDRIEAKPVASSSCPIEAVPSRVVAAQ